MRPLRLLFLVLVLAGALASCAGIPAPSPYNLSPQAGAYLTAALDIMQQHSVNRKKVDWAELRNRAFTSSNGAKTPADTYAAIRFALYMLGDNNHSRFAEPQDVKQAETATLTPDQIPHGKQLTQHIGYLELPHIFLSGQEAKRYAFLTQEVIRKADQPATCGWIVDLRKNNGENLWAMLAGISPLLEEDGMVGSFVDPDGNKQTWSYQNGQAQLKGSTVIEGLNPYHLQHSSPPVAVLMGQNTAGAGEAVVVAFRGRPHTLSFGEATFGNTTANNLYTLSDGAIINLASALYADRTGRTYDSAINPDQFLAPIDAAQIGTKSDTAIQAATTWLHDHQGCRN